MDAKGFFHSTTALITALGTMLAALVALGVFLLGEGVFKPTDEREAVGDGTKPGGKMQFEDRFGRQGTGGIELDGEKGIARKATWEGDIVFYSDTVTTYDGLIVEWTEAPTPSPQQCAELLRTHGAAKGQDIEAGKRFCVRSSGGRTAYLAIISDATEFYVAVWPKA